MKNFITLMFLILLSSCASLSPKGNWNYSITDTPEGSKEGVMRVAKMGEDFFCTVQSKDVELKFNKFIFDSKTKKANGNFDYQGMNFYLDAVVNHKQMVGSISTEGYNFPFKANKRK